MQRIVIVLQTAVLRGLVSVILGLWYSMRWLSFTGPALRPISHKLWHLSLDISLSSYVPELD